MKERVWGSIAINTIKNGQGEVLNGNSLKFSQHAFKRGGGEGRGGGCRVQGLSVHPVNRTNQLRIVAKCLEPR